MLERTKKRLKYGVLGLLVVVALAGGGGAWWLWGWSMGSLSFHESWSPAQRAALQHEADYLAHFIQHQEAANTVIFASEPQPRITLWDRLAAAIRLRPVLAGTMNELRHTAAEGRSPQHDPRFVPMVALAARLGQLPLAHALLERGESPQELFRYELMGEMHEESSFQTAISCAPFTLLGGSKCPVPQRLELLAHMLDKGADISPQSPAARQTTFYCCNLAALLDDGAGALEWLLNHGLDLRSQDERLAVADALCWRGTLEVMRRLVPKLHLGQDADERFVLLRGAVCPCADTLAKLSWLLEHLYNANPTAATLELNASRSIRNPYTRDPQTEPSPMERFCSYSLAQLETSLPHRDPARDATPNQVLDMLHILLSYGAKLPNPEKYLPTEESLRQKYMQVINSHGIYIAESE